MPIVLSRLDPEHLRTAVGLAGAGVWLADAGGGWTLVRAESADAAAQDRYCYTLAQALAELDPSTPVLLLWDADPDSGYVLVHRGRTDSHVWGVDDPAAARGDVRRVARAVGRADVADRLRPLLSGAAGGHERIDSPVAVRSHPVQEFATAIGADAPVTARVLAGERPVGELFLPRNTGCHGTAVAGPLPEAPRLVQSVAGGRWVPTTLTVLAVLFGLGVIAEAVLIAAGRGGTLGALGIVLFGLLTVLCVTVLLGLRRRVR